jgi:4-hydroxybenzoate polyprenyltransferase
VKAAAQPADWALAQSLRSFAADIKIVHSVFALPFAMAAFILGKLPLPSLKQALLLLGCMVTARSYAMGMNRYLDRKIDAINPRTRLRKIPKGDLSPRAGLSWSLVAGALFIAAAFTLSPLAGYCAPPVLCLLALYSMMKHLSWLTHWYLGFCLGMAPVGVAVAMTGGASLPILLVACAVCLWTAGFDILYALQDREFDREHDLRSVPRSFGPAWSLRISRTCFVLMIGALTVAGRVSGAGAIYFVGIACVAGLLVYEHVLVRDARETGHSRHLNLAFFNMNAYVSVIYFAFSALDSFVRF